MPDVPAQSDPSTAPPARRGPARSPVEAAALPAQISVCDHDYGRRGGAPKSAADVRAADGADPVVVGSGGGCPAGVCEATGTCLDVVYLQTTDNRYAGYELLDESS